ncbi:Golgi to ER traffic protein [Trichinella spiralis]|uniref:Golgi to ER traffic protein n=1 Tax=Trichinella spiralis TaxID=6334 RepID=A0ABR3L1Z3_TRISP
MTRANAALLSTFTSASMWKGKWLLDGNFFLHDKPFLHCPRIKLIRAHWTNTKYSSSRLVANSSKRGKAHSSSNFLGLGEDSFFYSLNSQQNLFSKLNFNSSIIREKPPDIASLLSFLFFQQQVDGVNLTSANIFHHSHPPSTIRTDHDPVNWLVLIIISLLIYESAVLSNLEEWEKGKRTNIADVSLVFVDNAESRGKKPSAEKQEEEEKRGEA